MVEAILFSKDFNERRGKWVEASYTLCGSNFFNVKDIQALGNADQRLRVLEAQNKAQFENTDQSKIPDGNDIQFIYESFRASELQAFSQLWIMGLYETLRRLSESTGAKRVEHMPSFPAGKDKQPHNAELMFNPSTGSMAWAVYCPKREDFIELIRQEVADEFLQITSAIRGENTANKEAANTD